MSVVVTGATGHLGRLTVEALLRRGVPASDVVATGRDVTGIKDLAERGVVNRTADHAPGRRGRRGAALTRIRAADTSDSTG